MQQVGAGVEGIHGRVQGHLVALQSAAQLIQQTRDQSVQVGGPVLDDGGVVAAIGDIQLGKKGLAVLAQHAQLGGRGLAEDALRDLVDWLTVAGGRGGACGRIEPQLHRGQRLAAALQQTRGTDAVGAVICCNCKDREQYAEDKVQHRAWA